MAREAVSGDASVATYLTGVWCLFSTVPSAMTDIQNPRLLYVKGVLFLLGGIMASKLILLECPTLKVALLLGLAVWCFARAYYFAFYVIERYIDPSYRFSGLWSCASYVFRHRRPA